MSTSHEPIAVQPQQRDAPSRTENGTRDRRESGRSRGPRDVAALAGVFAVGCLACLVPGLLAGGAFAAALGALGADDIAFGALAATLAIAAVVVTLRRRSHKAAAEADRCGC
jgi:hypothetical protein